MQDLDLTRTDVHIEASTTGKRPELTGAFGKYRWLGELSRPNIQGKSRLFVSSIRMHTSPPPLGPLARGSLGVYTFFLIYCVFICSIAFRLSSGKSQLARLRKPRLGDGDALQTQVYRK